MSSVEWPALLRAGLSQLRLTPEEFWRLTPLEFLLLAGRATDWSPATRETLERLARAFPDERKSR